MTTAPDRHALMHLAPPARRDLRWALLWVGGIALMWFWDLAFLNAPAFAQVRLALFNSLLGGVMVVVFSMVLGWGSALLLDLLEQRGQRLFYLVLTFLLNLVRSIPQIVGILLGAVVLTGAIVEGSLRSSLLQLVLMSFVVSCFVFLEVMDLIRERIDHYRKLDFVDAMLCCGMPMGRIINVEILRKNSLAHLLHKAVAVFGMAIFLQCSIDFIISVGLSTDVSSANFPATLGSVLARMDSKQDILAIGLAVADPGYVGALLTRHLQGITVAAMIISTLICTHHVANGLVRRHKL
jgi:ABC-type dipeptide/oligopeptide/nickel transport system permease subunit